MPDDTMGGSPTQGQPGVSSKMGKEKRQFAITMGLCTVAGITLAAKRSLPTWVTLVLASLIALAMVIAIIGIVPLLRKKRPD